MSFSIIGGADGPTSVFLAGKFEMGWLNLMGLIVVVLILLPNIAYAMKFRDAKNKCRNKWMNVLEQIGRYACMFLMIFNIGLMEFGFRSVGDFLVYLLGNGILVASYWVVWILFFRSQKPWKSMALAILPTLIFLLSGITLRHVLLMIAAVLFGAAHIYVTYENVKE